MEPSFKATGKTMSIMGTEYSYMKMETYMMVILGLVLLVDLVY